ncbi:MAG: hypothetical protein JW751_20525 [Polyangiaceae bacterium]|nr:hypothetical protein [Polyangiaceae bacterium]
MGEAPAAGAGGSLPVGGDAGTAGTLACTPGTADCNGERSDGCEASLAEDGNCGRCNRFCYPGACDAGQCTPGLAAEFPRRIYRGGAEYDAETDQIFVARRSGDDLWIHGTTRGGGPTALIELDTGYGKRPILVQDETHLYWFGQTLTSSDYLVFGAPKDDLEEYAPVVFEEYLYWIECASPCVYRALADGTGPVRLVSQAPAALPSAEEIGSLLIPGDDEYVYFTGADSVFRAPREGGDAERLGHLAEEGREGLPIALFGTVGNRVLLTFRPDSSISNDCAYELAR